MSRFIEMITLLAFILKVQADAFQDQDQDEDMSVSVYYEESPSNRVLLAEGSSDDYSADTQDGFLDVLADKLLDTLIDTGVKAWPLPDAALDDQSLFKMQAVAPYTRSTLAGFPLSSLRSPLPVAPVSVPGRLPLHALPQSLGISARSPQAFPVSRQTIARQSDSEAEAEVVPADEEAEAPAPAPAYDGEGPPTAYAIAKGVRGSAFKVRRVLNTIRGKRYDIAVMILQYIPYRSALPILKVLQSAASNAKQKFGVNKASLVITTAYADQGPVLKRFRPRAQGRGFKIRKPSSHITIYVSSIN